MIELEQEIAEARRMLEIRKSIAGKPGATVEQELSYQLARVHLLALENRVLRRIAGLQRKLGKQQRQTPRAEDQPKTAKQRAEAAFASLTKGAV